MLIKRPKTNYISNEFLSNHLDNALSSVVRDFFPYAHDTKENRVLSSHKENIYRDQNKCLILIAAPGYSKDNFDITLEGKTLIVKTKDIDTSKRWQENKTLIRHEFSINNFSKAWTLPNDLNLEKIEADYTAGILTIEIAAKEKKPNAIKSIEIN